tara:strand:+ start:278 stop:484 length:207 start_codon:yes stop_codon:yes gene_type:complete
MAVNYPSIYLRYFCSNIKKKEKTLSREEIYFITQIAVGIAVIISIIFVGLELRQNSFLMRKSMGDSRL